ncbi:VOC family protein [Bowmanella dokdonensis]|uniref:VOC family protein n=1 Tax=Bowmanella dokdonensis TaxID=751969 RepID=A0A939IRL8_9ALTE|nr:VOC family protein [Bowmanella dokdonensis]MBN7825782.1 VOC family protein [Bowmanella dokdonensis]
MNLNQITLPVNDMQAAVDFYLKLGMTQIVDTPHYARFSCPEGDSTFSLALQAEPVHNQAVIYFESNNLDAKVNDLTQRGIQFDQPPQDMPYLWREAILHDPAGNKIKLYHAGENRLNPPWRVTKTA